MITLDQVRSFVAVAEELHFGRAAERLQMTQPPLSRQIQKLEKSVGARLLERDNRRVELTGAGVAFLDEAYRLLNLVEGAGDLARRVDAGAAGVVRLGFTAVSAISILGPLLRRLTAELPDVEVVLSERVTNAQVDGIRRGELDLGLARPPFDTSLLRSRVVLREPYMAVVPAGHPLAAAERGVTLAPASAASLHVDGVVFKELAHHGGDTRVDADPDRPVELHAIWSRGAITPVVRRVLDVVTAEVDPRPARQGSPAHRS